jgi:SAM-dependent methyltransferase
VILRSRLAGEIADSYRTFLGKELPSDLIRKYFRDKINERYCAECDLRWYSPCQLAEEDLYEYLSTNYEWYYQNDTWDKRKARELLTTSQVQKIVEVGCGDGFFIKTLNDLDLCATGIDTNTEAILRGRKLGIKLVHASQFDTITDRFDCLCAFQTIEHVQDPVSFLNHYVAKCCPRLIVLSAPTHHSLLGKSSDPLAWPPHHSTQWSERAFSCLAAKMGYRLKAAYRDDLTFFDFLQTATREPKVPRSTAPVIFKGRLGQIAFKVCRLLGFSWARYRHSILVVLEKNV